MNIGSVIPQIFYDLIARITPGLVVILTGFFVWRGGEAAEQDAVRAFGWLSGEHSPVVLVLFAALFASYVLAFVLDGIWGFLPHRFFKEAVCRDEEKIIDEFKLLDPGFDAANYRFPGIALRYDAVRLRDANAGARLAKLRAELHMCRVMVLGLSILWVMNLMNFRAGFNWATLASEVVIAVGVASFIKTHNRLNDRFLWGSCNHWLLLVKPGTLNESKAGGPQEAAKAGGV
jgi:hypothetical protein